MTVSAVVVLFLKDAEVTFGGRRSSGANGNGHDEKGLGAFHDVGELFAGGDLHADA